MANYRYTYDYNGMRYTIDAPEGSTASDLQAIVSGSGRPPVPTAAPKPAAAPNATTATTLLKARKPLKAVEAPGILDYFTNRDAAIKQARDRAAYMRELGQRSKLKDLETQTGFFDRLGDLFTRGELNVTSGIKDISAAIELDPVLKKQYQAEARRFSEDAGAEIKGETTFGDVKSNPLKALPFILEQGAQSLPQMGLAVVNPLAAILSMGSTTGQVARGRAEANNRQDVSGTDAAIAAPIGIISTLLDQFGVGEIIGAAGKNAVIRTLKAGFAEGSTESVQNTLEYLGSRIGTEKGADAKEAFEQAAAGFIAGGGMGAGFRGSYEGARKVLGLGSNDAETPPPVSSRPSRPSAPPPAPPADMGVLAQALGPVGGKVTLQEPSGPRDYTFEGFDEDGGVVLADADGVIYSEDPSQVQAAIKAGVVEPESGLGGMSFGDDITEGLDDVVAPPPPPPPPAAGIGSAPKPKFTIEPLPTAQAAPDALPIDEDVAPYMQEYAATRTPSQMAQVEDSARQIAAERGAESVSKQDMLQAGMAFDNALFKTTPPPAAPPPPAADYVPSPYKPKLIIEPEAEPVEVAPAPPKFTIEMPPPSPKNTQGKSQVGKIVFDQEKGVGQVPLNQNVKYRGFTAMMRPSKFLELAADIDKPKQSSIDFIRDSIDEGRGVGSPFLSLDFKTGKIKGHDGRHRMMVIQEKNGDEPVPVHIFGEGEGRARSLNEGKINAFASNLTSERGNQSTDNFSEAFLEDAVVPVTPPPPAAPAADGAPVKLVPYENMAMSAMWYSGGSQTAVAGAKKPAWVPDDVIQYDIPGRPRPTGDQSDVRVEKFTAKDGTIGTQVSVIVPSVDEVYGDRGNTAAVTVWLRGAEFVDPTAAAETLETIARWVADPKNNKKSDGPLNKFANDALQFMAKSKAVTVGPATPAAAVAAPPPPPPPPPPPAAPRAVGKTARATIPATGEKVDVQYELQDLDNVKFAQDELQNRDRSRPASGAFITDFVKTFDPDRLGEHPETDRGAPVINKDNIILSGNGRTMGLQEIYGFHPDKAEIYKESLREQGYDIEGIERPVLVRRLMSDVNERKFVTASNEDDKAALSPPEQAAQDASDILTPSVFAKFNGGDLNAVKNDAFVSAFIAEMSTQQRKNAMDDKGKVNAQTLKRIENALLYKAYGDSSRASKIFISKAMERNDDDTKTLTNSLVDVSKDWIKFQQAIEAGEIDKKYNITNKLMETIGTASDIKASGNSVAFELRSPDMVEPMDPFVREILLAFHNDDVSRILSRKAIAEKLKAYTEVAAVQQAEPDMLGMSETPSARDIWKRIDDGEGAPQSSMFASIQPIPPKRRAEILDQGGKIPSLSRGIDKLKKLWANGKIDTKEFAFEVASYSNFIEDLKSAKRWDQLGKPKVRGPDRIREELLKQKRLGRISPEEVDFAEWFIRRNENLLDDLGVSSIKPPEDGGYSGFYKALTRVMYLIKDRAEDGTVVHEIMHHLERMLPQDIRMAIKRAWAKELDKFEALSYEGTNEDDKLFFKAIRAFHNQEQIKIKDRYYSPRGAFEYAVDLIESGEVDGRLYQYVNPSEFWAVNATDILQGRYNVQGSLLGRLKNWLRELSIKIKGLFKLDSNAPIIKALDSLAKSDGKFVSNQMLEEKSDYFNNVRESKRLTAIAAAAALASSPVKATINDTPIAPNSALYKSLESGDTKKAIEIIQKSSKNPAARRIASILALNGVGEQKTVILDPVNNLDKTIATLSKNGADQESIDLISMGDVRGMVLSTAKDKNIYLIKNPVQASNGVNEQTFLHEAIHAYVKARWSSVAAYIESNREVLDNRGLYNEEVAAEVKKFNAMWRKFGGIVKKEYEGGAGVPSTVISAAETPNEALSYLLTNKGVQEYAKRIVKDGNGYRLMSEKEAGKRSWWDDFVDMLRKIFGMAPARDQFFNDFLDAGNSVLAVGKKTKADFRVAAINDEEVSPKNVTNNEQAMKALTNGTPDQMRDAVAKAQKPYDKSNEEAAKLQSKNRGCD